MVAIANDVLDFSKLEAGKLKLENVEFEWLPLLEELVAIAAERARTKGSTWCCVPIRRCPTPVSEMQRESARRC